MLVIVAQIDATRRIFLLYSFLFVKQGGESGGLSLVYPLCDLTFLPLLLLLLLFLSLAIFVLTRCAMRDSTLRMTRETEREREMEKNGGQRRIVQSRIMDKEEEKEKEAGNRHVTVDNRYNSSR